MKRILVMVGAGMLGVSGPAHAVLPEDVAVGTRVEVEGTLTAPFELTATEVEVKRTNKPKAEIEGRVDSIDVPGRSLVVAGVKVQLLPDAEVRAKDERKIEFSKVQAGQKAEAEGTFENGVLRAKTVEAKELDEDEARKVEIEGTITELDAARTSFRVMGYRILVTPRTKVVLQQQH